MKLFTVSFFGHRIVSEFREAEERVEALIHTLLLENEYVEFLVGRNGDFDQIVTSAVKRQQRRVRDDNSALIWILPYPTAELRDNLESFDSDSQPADGGSKRSCGVLCRSFQRWCISNPALRTEKEQSSFESCIL